MLLLIWWLGFFFFSLSALTPKWEVISVKGVKADKLKKPKNSQPPDQYTKGEFAIKLNLGSEELSWLFSALQSFHFLFRMLCSLWILSENAALWDTSQKLLSLTFVLQIREGENSAICSIFTTAFLGMFHMFTFIWLQILFLCGCWQEQLNSFMPVALIRNVKPHTQ